MALYSTLDNALSIMGTVTGQITTQASIDSDLVLQNIRVVTQRINNRFPNTPRFLPMFEPYYAALRFPLSSSDISSAQNVLRFPAGYLLELTGVNINGTAITAGTDVDGFPDASQPPFSAIQLTNFYGSWYNYCGTLTRTPMITVSGWWGFSTNYANAWAALTTLNGGINASVTSITVTDVDALGVYGYGVAISAGNLIRIDDELMEVLSTVIATNVVTVRRGVNGSTAAAHLTLASVEVWQVEDSVARACARQAGFLYRRFGAYTTSEITPLGSEIKYPTDWLQEVYSTLQGYQYI